MTKWNKPIYCLSIPLLRLVRDWRPTEAELLDWLGPEGQGRFYTLRKVGLILVEDGRVVWSPEHLSDDGRHFWYGNRRYWLDEDRIDTFRPARTPHEEGQNGVEDLD